jgi:hypothetical protein
MLSILQCLAAAVAGIRVHGALEIVLTMGLEYSFGFERRLPL